MSLGAFLRYWGGVGAQLERKRGWKEMGRQRDPEREERQGALGSREPLWPQEAM